MDRIEDGIKIVCKDHKEWGIWTVGHDRNGWTIRSDRGERMLDIGELKFWDEAV